MDLKEYQKKYQPQYQRRRYLNKKQEFIDYLGGKCVMCGAKKGLEFDHINRSAKDFSIMSKWKLPLDDIKEELDKCQLLCKSCHLKKTKEDLGQHDYSGVPKSECNAARGKIYYYRHRDEILKKRRDRRKTQNALQKRSTGGGT